MKDYEFISREKVKIQSVTRIPNLLKVLKDFATSSVDAVFGITLKYDLAYTKIYNLSVFDDIEEKAENNDNTLKPAQTYNGISVYKLSDISSDNNTLKSGRSYIGIPIDNDISSNNNNDTLKPAQTYNGIPIDSDINISNNNNNNVPGTAKRFDVGKPRFSLIPPAPLEEIAKVLTMGAEKYGDRNWEKGMKWTRCIDSLERHLNAWKSGENLDKESGLPHLAHVCVNSMFLLQYEETYPQGDDRK